LEAYLSQQEMDEPQLQKAIKHDLLLQKIQEGNINNRLRITEREIDEFLESKAGKEWTQTRFRLAHILLPIEGDGGNTAIAKAQKLVEQAEESSSKFQELAAAYSKGPNASKGGDLGWRMKNELPSLFLEQVATLKSGDISQPFRSNAGVHILKVIQRSGAEPVMVERFKVRHVLIKPTPLFTDAEAKAKIDGLYQQLLQDTDFNTLAKEYTEDTGSKSEGGDLGWSTPGKFVPVFENTMKETPLGEISKPFRSQFGWHILKVDDSRVEDMFDVVKRNQVVSILRKRRFQDELQLWLQELREDAYVEVLI
jgi:peptidyl-prolyl cis-trans isomerase SurA